MSWLTKFVERLKGRPENDWTFVPDLQIDGSDLGEVMIRPDECYVELYVDALQLKEARRFATTFDGIVYAFAKTAREGEPPSTLSAIASPSEITGVGQAALEDVITINTRLFKYIPWRGPPLDLEIGVFAVKSGNIASKLASYVVKVAEKVSPGAAAVVNPFLPLMHEGLDLLAGQTADVALEIALDTSLTPTRAGHYAIIRAPDGSINLGELTVSSSGQLSHCGRTVLESYCVFSIRVRDDNPDFGQIEPLRNAFADLKNAIVAGTEREAQDALAAFRQQLAISPDLIQRDKVRRRAQAEAMMRDAFPGGQISDESKRRAQFGKLELTDLDKWE